MQITGQDGSHQRLSCQLASGGRDKKGNPSGPVPMSDHGPGGGPTDATSQIVTLIQLPWAEHFTHLGPLGEPRVPAQCIPALNSEAGIFMIHVFRVGN